MTETSELKREYQVGKKVYRLQTEKIFQDETIRLPFKDEDVPFVDLATNDNDSNLAQRSRKHGRATFDTRIEKQVVYFDTYGNIFTTREWKGNTIPDFRKLKITGGNLWGLMTLESLGNINEVSQFMRKNGLPTEAIISAHFVKTVYFDGVEIPIEKAKEKYKVNKTSEIEKQSKELDTKILSLLKKIKVEPNNKPIQSRDFLVSIEDKIPKDLTQEYDDIVDQALYLRLDKESMAKGIIDRAKVIAVERGMPVGERLSDLDMAETMDEYKSILKPILEKINFISKVKGNIMPNLEPPKHIDTNSAEGLKYYFNEYLPKQMGAYLGRFHKLGLAHHYTHGSNWNTIGILVDLDSVTGKIDDMQLGSANKDDFSSDATVSFNVLMGTVNKFLQTERERAYDPKDFQKIIESFITNYCIEFLKDKPANIDIEDELLELRVTILQNVGLRNTKLDVQIWDNVQNNVINSRKTKRK